MPFNNEEEIIEKLADLEDRDRAQWLEAHKNRDVYWANTVIQ